MKSVAIVTLYHKNYNFGGQLQAYALCKIISSHGFKCKVIDLVTTGRFHKIYVIGLRKTISRFFSKMKWKYHYTMNKRIRTNIRKKIELFDKFMDEIPHSPRTEYSEIDNIAKDYDFWVTGSDQVWNPEAFCLNRAYLLHGIDQQIKISYAASHWNMRYTEHQKKMLREDLNNFSAISVREETLARAISECTDNPVSAVLDPTLLFNSQQWNEIAVSPGAKQKYAFVYLIHSCDKTKENIYNYCKRHKLKMIIVPHTQSWYKSADEKYYDIQAAAIGPKEWIGYIKNAEIVFTDSFHGTVFSVNYHKKFWSFENLSGNIKTDMNSRKYNILRSLGLDNRCVPYSFNLKQDVISEPIKYENADKQLNKLRERSLRYLKSALQIEEDEK